MVAWPLHYDHYDVWLLELLCAAQVGARLRGPGRLSPELESMLPALTHTAGGGGMGEDPQSKDTSQSGPTDAQLGSSLGN